MRNDDVEVLKWLMEDDAPGVQYLVRGRLLGEDPASRKMCSLRKRCNEYPPVARMLGRVDEAIGARRYHKYKGAFWTLIFLAEMQIDGRDRRVRKLAEHVLDAQLENGGFSTSGQPRYEIVCLTANVLRSLIHLGYGKHDGVVRGYQRLAERILSHGGVPCVVLGNCLHTSCKMTLPHTLRCLAVAPPGAPKAKMKKIRGILVKQMLDVRVYRYVRPDVKEFYEAVRKRSKGVTQHAVRSDWMKKHKFRDSQLQPKPGWKRFGFPRSYNSDILEAMFALTELGVQHGPILDEPLDHIESKRGKEGLWKLDDSLNGKMLADIERKGRPSKWITLRAMSVLKHFGRSEL